jgi:nucleoside-diphosphate-sugar epimerase
MQLFIFGFGFSAQAIARYLGQNIQSMTVTTRSSAKAEALRDGNVQGCVFDGCNLDTHMQHVLEAATHILVSIPPDDLGDPVLNVISAIMPCLKRLQWIGYLSTVGVYGDHQGAWVDENTLPRPQSARSIQRLRVEKEWQALVFKYTIPLAIFRLSGIYGPGRSPLDKLREGRARRVIKPDQVFNRIHVDDIGQIVGRAARVKLEGIYNVTDDLPAPPQDVIAYGAELMAMPPPSAIDFELAHLSPMARSFYSENKRVDNKAIKSALGVNLLYPSYKEGLKACL